MVALIPAKKVADDARPSYARGRITADVIYRFIILTIGDHGAEVADERLENGHRMARSPGSGR